MKHLIHALLLESFEEEGVAKSVGCFLKRKKKRYKALNKLRKKNEIRMTILTTGTTFHLEGMIGGSNL